MALPISRHALKKNKIVLVNPAGLVFVAAIVPMISAGVVGIMDSQVAAIVLVSTLP